MSGVFNVVCTDCEFTKEVIGNEFAHCFADRHTTETSHELEIQNGDTERVVRSR